MPERNEKDKKIKMKERKKRGYRGGERQKGGAAWSAKIYVLAI